MREKVMHLHAMVLSLFRFGSKQKSKSNRFSVFVVAAADTYHDRPVVVVPLACVTFFYTLSQILFVRYYYLLLLLEKLLSLSRTPNIIPMACLLA